MKSPVGPIEVFGELGVEGDAFGPHCLAHVFHQCPVGFAKVAGELGRRLAAISGSRGRRGHPFGSCGWPMRLPQGGLRVSDRDAPQLGCTTGGGLRKNPLPYAVGRALGAKESDVAANAARSHDDQSPLLLTCSH